MTITPAKMIRCDVPDGRRAEGCQRTDGTGGATANEARVRADQQGWQRRTGILEDDPTSEADVCPRCAAHIDGVPLEQITGSRSAFDDVEGEPLTG